MPAHALSERAARAALAAHFAPGQLAAELGQYTAAEAWDRRVRLYDSGPLAHYRPQEELAQAELSSQFVIPEDAEGPTALTEAAHRSVSGYQGRYEMREIVNALLYQGRTGCQWDLLPHDLPPRDAVMYYFTKWPPRPRCHSSRQPSTVAIGSGVTPLTAQTRHFGKSTRSWRNTGSLAQY